MASEFERIDRLRARFASTPVSPAVQLGIGDDAAVLAPSSLPQVWTVDTAEEDVHFSRAFMALEAIGYRAFMAAASDLAAMGAQAVAALSALVLPPTLSEAELDALAEGLARAADTCACPIVGGNLTRGQALSLTTTVLGACASPLRRSGARPGDGVFVTGPVGGAALGLRALKAGVDGFDAEKARFLAPRARLDLSAQLGLYASACIDISDGLAQDLGHLCRASGVRAEISLECLPLLDGFAENAAQLSLDPWELALAGGEDYELVFTASTAVPPELGTRIGRIERGPPEVRLSHAGAPFALPRGFDHFR